MTATVAASTQGSLRHIPGNSAQCSLSLHLAHIFIQYSAIKFSFVLTANSILSLALLNSWLTAAHPDLPYG